MTRPSCVTAATNAAARMTDFDTALAAQVEPNRIATLGKIQELLTRNGIDVDDIGRVQRVNLWQGFHKDNDGEAQVVDLVGVQLSPAWADGPQWPVVQPGPLYKLPTRATRRKAA